MSMPTGKADAERIMSMNGVVRDNTQVYDDGAMDASFDRHFEV